MKPSTIRILHFNDVYNIEESANQEPCGGVPRFVSAVKQHSNDTSLVIFSGDGFSPSPISTALRGKHMPPCLNLIGVDIACVGNHDFDFGIEHMTRLVGQTKFPWLLSNCDSVETGEPLGGVPKTHMMNWKGWKIGFLGLIEKDWLDTLGCIHADEVEYTDFVAAGKELSKQLKDQGADLIVAMTHMREKNDYRLAREAYGYVDIILGGHDHHYVLKHFGSVPVVKSGTEFRHLSVIDIDMTKRESSIKANVEVVEENTAKYPDGWRGENDVPSNPYITIKTVPITRELPRDPEAAQLVEGIIEQSCAKAEKVIGHVNVALDARFSSVRTQETNVGNFICDIIRAHTDADLAILNGGTLRADEIQGPGDYRLKDLQNLIPTDNPIVSKEMTGEQIIRALENGVSKYPSLEGRFPQVSGITFEFDPELPPGNRVLRDTVYVGCGEDEPVPIDFTKKYSVGMHVYMASGKDGYTVMTEADYIIDPENSVPLPTLVRNSFQSLLIMNKMTQKEKKVRDAVDRLLRSKSVRRARSHRGNRFAISPRVEGRVRIRGVSKPVPLSRAISVSSLESGHFHSIPQTPKSRDETPLHITSPRVPFATSAPSTPGGSPSSLALPPPTIESPEKPAWWSLAAKPSIHTLITAATSSLLTATVILAVSAKRNGTSFSDEIRRTFL